MCKVGIYILLTFFRQLVLILFLMPRDSLKCYPITNFRVSTFLFLFSKGLKDLSVNKVSINKHPSRKQHWTKNIISSELQESNDYKIRSSPNAGVPNNNTYACHISSVLVIRSLPKFMYLVILGWRVIIQLEEWCMSYTYPDSLTRFLLCITIITQSTNHLITKKKKDCSLKFHIEKN